MRERHIRRPQRPAVYLTLLVLTTVLAVGVGVRLITLAQNAVPVATNPAP